MNTFISRSVSGLFVQCPHCVAEKGPTLFLPIIYNEFRYILTHNVNRHSAIKYMYNFPNYFILPRDAHTRITRYCCRKLSARLSVCNFEVLWSFGLGTSKVTTRIISLAT